MNERIFAGVYATGIVYADRQREKCGDYARLAFLSFSTLKLEISPDCPKELIGDVIKDAVAIQDRKGQQFNTSTCGQPITLGYALEGLQNG